MAKERRKKVTFTVTEKVNKPKVVNFATKSGNYVRFTATEKVNKPKVVKFYAKPKKKK